MKILLETEEYKSRTAVPSTQKLEAECKKISRDLYWKKTDQYIGTHKLNSQRSELEELKQQMNQWNNALEEQQHLHRLYHEHDTLKMQLHSLHHKLRHNSGNLSSERAIIRELTQLQTAKGSPKEKSTQKVENPLNTEELVESIQSNIKYIRTETDRTRKQYMVKQHKINQLDKEENMLDRRVKFLERKLAKIYLKIEANSDGSNVLCK